jgi:hypothetical protein
MEDARMLGLILATRVIDQRFVGEYGPVILNGVGEKEKSDPCNRVDKPKKENRKNPENTLWVFEEFHAISLWEEKIFGCGGGWYFSRCIHRSVLKG